MIDVKSEIDKLANACGGTVSVAVRNVSNAFDFSYNDDARIGSASTIKLPMLVEAMRQVRDGMLTLDMPFCITKEQCCPGSGVIAHLHEGVSVTLKDLLTLMIIVSDNTATNILIDTLGMENVNSTLRGWGYTGTELMRKMYDWSGIAEGRDNFIVAREAADLLAKVARKEAVGGEWDQMIFDILKSQLYGDELGLLLPEGVLANKTGQVEGVVNDCGIVTTDKFCYSIAVFTKDAPIPGEAKVTIGRISKVVWDAVVALGA